MSGTNKQHKIVTKKSLYQIVDFRNGKFQGETQQSRSKYNGIGMIIDHNYLLALAFWKNDQIEGPSLVLFPDHSLFYGTFINKQLNGFSCFSKSFKYKIYANFKFSSKDYFIFEPFEAKTLFLMQTKLDLIRNTTEDGQNHLSILFQLEKSKEKDIIYDGERKYQNQDEKWDIIQKYLQINIKNEHRSYKGFIRSHFNSNNSCQIEINQSKQQFQFSFPESSIICRISERKINNNTDFYFKIIGYYDMQKNIMQIYRKISNYTVQQKNDLNENLVQYLEGNIRPQTCSYDIKQYFKKSLNFRNIFINLEYCYKQALNFCKIQIFLRQRSIVIQAQRLFENSFKISSNDNDFPHKNIQKKQQLERIRVQIERISKKRSNSKRNSPKSISNSRITYNNQNKSRRQSKNDLFHYQEYKNYTPVKSPKAEKRYNYFLEDNEKLKASPSRRNFAYLPEETNQSKPLKKQKSLISFKEQNHKTKERYEYLNQNNHNKNGSRQRHMKTQNFKTLTDHYQQIKRQISREAPKLINNTKISSKKKINNTINHRQSSPVINSYNNERSGRKIVKDSYQGSNKKDDYYGKKQYKYLIE